MEQTISKIMEEVEITITIDEKFVTSNVSFVIKHVMFLINVILSKTFFMVIIIMMGKWVNKQVNLGLLLVNPEVYEIILGYRIMELLIML